jgi:NADPH:quinone reductase-like Zn-dependent oxidoreductase
MKAAVAAEAGMPSYADFRDPVADADGEVVEVLAAALTNLDIATTEGRHYLRPGSYPAVAGKECVGRTADGTRRFYTVGSIVPPFGSLASHAKVRPEFGLPIPDGVPDALAAAVGNAGLAAWLPLSWRAKLEPGETVLVLGATGTTGRLAVAAAKLLGAGRVIAVGRNAGALADTMRYGADATVQLSSDTDLAAACRDAARGEVNLVIDYLHGPVAEAALTALARGGRLVQVGSAAGPSMTIHAQVLRRGCIDLLGFAYYHAPIAEQAAAYTQLCRCAMSARLAIETEVLVLADIQEAWRRQTAGSRARIVLVPSNGRRRTVPPRSGMSYPTPRLSTIPELLPDGVAGAGSIENAATSPCELMGEEINE